MLLVPIVRPVARFSTRRRSADASPALGGGSNLRLLTCLVPAMQQARARSSRRSPNSAWLMALLLRLPQRPRPMSDQAKAQFQVGAPRMAALGPRSHLSTIARASCRLGSPYRSGRSPHWVRVKKSESVRSRGRARRIGVAEAIALGNKFPGSRVLP
jgi:hypothetical protein